LHRGTEEIPIFCDGLSSIEADADPEKEFSMLAGASIDCPLNADRTPKSAGREEGGP
jgi:hypothetical protein